jgi:HrpA-like RNA helicase
VVDGTSRCAHRRSVHEVVPDNVVKDQLSAAAILAREVATPGGAVLIFVSGMSDITELMELLTAQMQGSRRGAGSGEHLYAVYYEF